MRSEDGGPWKFTREQLRFVLHWYALDDNGRFSNRKGVLQRMKGWGKDPLLAVLCLVELVGPSRFTIPGLVRHVRALQLGEAGPFAVRGPLRRLRAAQVLGRPER